LLNDSEVSEPQLCRVNEAIIGSAGYEEQSQIRSRSRRQS